MTTIAEAFLEDFEDDQANTAEPLLEAIPLQVVTIDMEADSDKESPQTITDLLENTELIELRRLTQKLILKDPSKALFLKAEDCVEYPILMRSTEMAKKIEEQIFTVHRHNCDLYAARFPELEQTLLHPVNYARVVKKIGNNIDNISCEIEGMVSEHIKLSAAISASATSGEPLGEEDLKRVELGCETVLQLDKARNDLLDYTKSRILYLAPNLSALVGPQIAVQMMIQAGGLKPLSTIPSCNLQSLGATKKTGETSSTMFSADPHMGILMKTKIMLECPEELSKKALRMLAAKAILAIRIDCHQTKLEDAMGRKYAETIREKIQKWQEAQEIREDKPLPLPPEKRASKRAGKRYRKMRDKYKVTELQRMRNRVGFNVGEAKGDQDEEGFGMIGKSGVGGVLKISSNSTVQTRKLERINKLMVERERKKRQKRLMKGDVSGVATSVVMNEAQGMSFVNPENNPVRQNNESGVSTYFGTKSFTKLKM